MTYQINPSIPQGCLSGGWSSAKAWLGALLHYLWFRECIVSPAEQEEGWEPCAFPLHCASETVSLLPALLCRGTGLSGNLLATAAKAGSKGSGEESSVQSHLSRTMAPGYGTRALRASQCCTGLSMAPLSLFVQCPGRAARKECSSGMVTALCPQACLPDLGGKGQSLTFVTRGEIC